MTAGNDSGRAAPRRRQGESSVTETGDGVLAWMVLRQVGEYREAWDRHAAAGASAATEPGPFPIRVQTEADRKAERFEMLAWEDPGNADGPASAFWRQDGSKHPAWTVCRPHVDPGMWTCGGSDRAIARSPFTVATLNAETNADAEGAAIRRRDRGGLRRSA